MLFILINTTALTHLLDNYSPIPRLVTMLKLYVSGSFKPFRKDEGNCLASEVWVTPPPLAFKTLVITEWYIQYMKLTCNMFVLMVVC